MNGISFTKCKNHKFEVKMAPRERKVLKYMLSHRKSHTAFCSRIYGVTRFSFPDQGSKLFASKNLDSSASATKEADLFVIAANNIGSSATFAQLCSCVLPFSQLAPSSIYITKAPVCTHVLHTHMHTLLEYSLRLLLTRLNLMYVSRSSTNPIFLR